jgi:hypothetical protein
MPKQLKDMTLAEKQQYRKEVINQLYRVIK